MKYNTLLKGLNLSERKYSSVISWVETLRLDSEYYAKEHIETDVFIGRNPDKFVKFSSLGLDVDCSAFYAAIEPFYGKGEIPLIRVQNVKDTIDYDSCVKLPLLRDTQYSTLKQVKEGDIVITKGGTIGKVGYITKAAYASRDLIFINSSSLPECQRIFLFLYLSTDFVYKQQIRSSSQCAQPHLTVTLVKSLDIFMADDDLQTHCYDLYKKSQECLKKSNELYHKAEDLLLECLGSHTATTNTYSYNIKTLRESFSTSGRLDAEYYMPKYESLYTSIKGLPVKHLGQLTMITKSIEPGSEAYKDRGIPFIRVANLSKFGITSSDVYLDGGLYANIVRPTADTILLSKDGTIGIAYKVDKDLNAITSGAILHLTVTKSDILPDCLTLILNSPIVQLQAERNVGGSVIQHWRMEEIARVQIPLLPMCIQKDISSIVQESFRLRKESASLVQQAKDMVEAEINGMMKETSTDQ